MQPIDVYTVIRQLTWAFRPLTCLAEVYDFEKQFRYRVFDPAGGLAIVSVSGLLTTKLLNPRALHEDPRTT